VSQPNSKAKKLRLKAYLQVAPVDLGSAIRLYVSYLASFVIMVLFPTRRYHVEDFIPGRSVLTVKALGVLANIRPRSEDLHVMTPAYEPITSNFFTVEPGSVVVDVGAHIGRYTLTAAQKARKVISIEADPSNFSLLRQNIRLNRFSNVIPLCLGISRERGKSVLHVAERSSGSTSSLERSWSGTPADAHTVEIRCETLDNLIEALGVGTVDWLKIDVEGHEVSVLQGAPKTLARTQRLVIEIANGNEEACRGLTCKAGLDVVGVGEDYGRAANWLFIRKHSL